MDALTMLQQLMGTVPGDFVTARNRLAKELAATGDRAAADAVKALRRPAVDDWALNVAAAVAPQVTAEFVATASSVLDAQRRAMTGRRVGDLRERLQELRRHTAAVAAVAHREASERGLTGRGSAVDDLTARLGAIAGNPAALDLLSRRLLGTEEPGEADPFHGVALDSEPADDEQSAADDADQAAAAAAAEAARWAEAIAAAEAALAAAERDVATRHAEMAEAAAALAAAEQRRENAARALAASREA